MVVQGGTRDSIPGGSDGDEHRPRHGEVTVHVEVSVAAQAAEEKMCLGGREEAEQGGGLYSQGLKKSMRIWAVFSRQWGAMESLFRSILLNDFCAAGLEEKHWRKRHPIERLLQKPSKS